MVRTYEPFVSYTYTFSYVQVGPSCLPPSVQKPEHLDPGLEPKRELDSRGGIVN